MIAASGWRTYPLREGATVVGRQSPDVTIASTDGMLSRRHLVFVRSGRDVSVKDLGSANGTQVAIAVPLPLKDGDRLIFGQQVMQFRDEIVTRHPPTRSVVDDRDRSRSPSR